MVSRFLCVESCGQCPPCKLGTGEITAAPRRPADGDRDRAHVEVIGEWLGKVTDGSRCFLATEEAQLVGSLSSSSPPRSRSTSSRTAAPDRAVSSSRSSSTSATATPIYDERQPRKPPDWTYA